MYIQEVRERNKQDLSWMNQVNVIHEYEDAESSYDEAIRVFRKNPFGRRKESQKRKTPLFYERSQIIQDDIYSMAYCALIDPKMVHK